MTTLKYLWVNERDGRFELHVELSADVRLSEVLRPGDPKQVLAEALESLAKRIVNRPVVPPSDE